MNQTYRNLELFLIDDGSTDDSGEICDTYALQDERVITAHKCNAGEAASRNYGIVLSSGDYLHVIDQDDYAECDMYHDMMQYAVCSPDLIKGEYVINQKPIHNCYPTGVMLDRGFITKEVIPFTIETQIDEAKKFSGHWSMLSRLSLVKERNLLYDESLPKMNDSKFMVDLLAVTNSVFFLDKCYYHWMRRSGSLTSKYSDMFSGITSVADYYESIFPVDEYGYDFYSQDKLKHNVRFMIDSLDLVIVHWRSVNVFKKMGEIFTDDHCRKWFDKLEPYNELTIHLKHYVKNGQYSFASLYYLLYFILSHIKSKVTHIIFS